ncbi:hypothetical protein F9U64_11010 [Gracilibacillus oryzae]|uniref:Uncharacterized protein n=1 Tax=Gracilibacillus oryzae TaxID=1672701 RepID=A0A7C8KSD1_9BACI|nr:hypothetical protein [Gracilibacillus oryzae]KAB8135790.1 hypothetical protein F9U64_11010 [Gracilibacillus oryzae]
MYQYRLYNEEEIKKLKDDLQRYKEAVTEIELKKDSSSKMSALNDKLVKLKGEMIKMEESYQDKIKHKEQEEQKLTTQFRSLNHSINQLKEDVSLIKGEVRTNHIQDLLSKVDHIMSKTSQDLTKVKQEMSSQKKEISQLKNTVTPNRQRKPYNSEYRQIQTMLSNIKEKNSPNQQLNTFRPRNTIPSNPSSQNYFQGSVIEKDPKTISTVRLEAGKNIINRPKKRTKIVPEKNIEQGTVNIDEQKLPLQKEDTRLEQTTNNTVSSATNKNITEQIKLETKEQELVDLTNVETTSKTFPDKKENKEAEVTDQYQQSNITTESKPETVHSDVDTFSTNVTEPIKEDSLPIETNSEQSTENHEKNIAASVSAHQDNNLDTETLKQEERKEEKPLEHNGMSESKDPLIDPGSAKLLTENNQKQEQESHFFQENDKKPEMQADETDPEKVTGWRKTWLFAKSLWKKTK